MQCSKRRFGAMIAAAAATTLFASLVSAAPAHAVREDCASKYACGWTEALFGDYEWGKLATSAWNANLTGNDNNSFTSIRNSATSTKQVTFFDTVGSSTNMCLKPNYEHSNLAQTNLNNKISYVQSSGYAC